MINSVDIRYLTRYMIYHYILMAFERNSLVAAVSQPFIFAICKTSCNYRKPLASFNCIIIYTFSSNIIK